IKTDSLQQLINARTTNDEEKVQLLNEYAGLCFYNQEVKKGFIATKEAREISEKLDFEGGEIMYYLTLSAYHANGNEDMYIYYQKRAEWLSNSMGDLLQNYYVDLEIPDSNFDDNYKQHLEKYAAVLEYFNNNEDKEIQANLLMAIAGFNYQLNNMEETIKIIDRMIELFKGLNQVYPVFLISTYKMTILKTLGQEGEAKKIELDLINLFVKNENENAIGLIANSMAAGYAEDGRYLLSIEYYLKSIEAFERIQDHEMLSKTYFDLAVAYENLNLNNKAYDSYAKAIAELKLNKDTVFSNMVYGTMVFPAIATEKYDEARKYMALALRDTVNANKYFLLARFNDANGQILKKQEKYEEAIPYFKKALDLFKQTGITWTAPFMPLYLTECYYEIGEYNTALEFGLRCLELEDSLNLNQTLTKKRASLWLSKIYQELGNIPKAYSYLKQYQEITEESERLDELNRIADAEIQAVLDKSKKEIDELERERLLTNQKNRIQRLWIFSIAGALLSALVVALILFRNNKNKQRANKLLKEQKEEIQTTLEQLESAQSQLIQAEKMASLGELTAGIAHEIQNPLNFVNNFSEVNSELIDEADQQLDNGNIPETKEILNDIRGNERKISHHGKRAESIVKGMLLHSRNSSGKKELTDINSLCDEYLRLAYHGFRAKDKSFNADFKLEADESLPKIEVVPQDIGRVLLNLINNAFYAVNKREKELTSQPPDGGLRNSQTQYKPVVTVSTTSFLPPSGGTRGVKITVKDNGPGIPSVIKDKIFQPFFTTKPTGSGTGLGLSLSYDIIKAHGGEIKLKSKENEGTEFIVILPVKQ
ncbi:MAG TPA: ATP-binding protein, partial [Prolixibacteraceae bacterium]|nr:ATP-binding protein [Prolixibacteraceae bacterium]